MIQFSMRATPRLVQQIATVERLAGRWDRLSLSPAVASDELYEKAIFAGAGAAFALDSTSPPDSSSEGYIETHRLNTSLSPVFVEQLYEQLISSNGSRAVAVPMGDTLEARELDSGKFRNSVAHFEAPAGYDGTSTKGEVVFSTVSSFLIEQRLRELLEWTEKELELGTYHPLVVIGVFHLLFLQIHPYPTANHRLALVMVWHLLKHYGYSFVRYAHFSPFFSEEPKQYFAALRKAEKTAGESWSTVNAWLELFLEALCQSIQELLAETEPRTEGVRLTQVQSRILEIVRVHGPVTREKIVNQTGLNLSTVKYNLGVLSERGHIKRQGGGRATSYRLI